MTTDDRFGTSLSSWLREDAAHRVPGHLAETLVQTAATRQRPWWSSLERLLPMSTLATGGVITRRPAAWFAMVALLAAAALGAALLVGALTITPAPTGVPSNGRIVVIDGSTISTFAADGTDRRELLSIPGVGSVPAISPDGTRVAVTRGTMPPEIHVVTLADGATRVLTLPEADVIAEEPLSWSPDGRSVTFAGLADGREQVFVAAVDGTSVEIPTTSKLDPNVVVWQPAFSPDGEWIAFATRDTRTSYGSLHVMRPDGSDLRALTDARTRMMPSVETGDGGGPVWGRDPAVHLIAYVTFANGGLATRVFDLDANTDHAAGPGFWPSWSPDGEKLATCCATIVEIDDVLAGQPDPVTAFGQPGEGGCGDFPDWSGRAICSTVVWSPDGQWLLAGDISRRDLLIAPVDGSAPPKRITLAAANDIVGDRVHAAWQPVWP
jgi:Tol biopolymer transport system component